MPHDKNGALLKIGDVVTIAAKITDVLQSDEYCNLSLISVEPMYPTSAPTSFSVNAKQVVKQE